MWPAAVLICYYSPSLSLLLLLLLPSRYFQ